MPDEATRKQGRRVRPSTALAFLAGTLVALLLAGIWIIARPGAGAAGVDPSLARTMALSDRIAGSTPAPDFSLVDQHGHTVRLSAFRGRPVVLTFLDPHCTDVCPIISAEFLRADKQLGHGSSVAFVAVNVNPYATSPAAVSGYMAEHGLDGLGNFTFATGAATQLAPVWKDYGVYVQAPDPTADVVHTSVTYFIDRSGVIRYEAMPDVDHRSDGSSYLPQGTIDQWGAGIAQVVSELQHT